MILRFWSTPFYESIHPDEEKISKEEKAKEWKDKNEKPRTTHLELMHLRIRAPESQLIRKAYYFRSLPLITNFKPGEEKVPSNKDRLNPPNPTFYKSLKKKP
jgi:hypothetical protein